MVLAILSMWLSFPLRELNGYAWFAESGMEEASAFSGNLLRLFRFTVPVLSLIPLLYAALCKHYHERLGLDRKTLRVLVGVGVIAGGLALVASVDELKRDLKTERMNRVRTEDVRLAIRLNQKDGDIEQQIDGGHPA